MIDRDKGKRTVTRNRIAEELYKKWVRFDEQMIKGKK